MDRMPVIFISHGSPMLALDGEEWGLALRDWALALPRPKAVVVLSAHWESPVGGRPGAVAITSAARPGILHDFGGFPPELYRLDYPVAGDPERAESCRRSLAAAGFEVHLDGRRPLDHGVWAPLRSLFPDADIPVVQISLPDLDPAGLLRLGQCLSPLREEGVLLMASGGLVHNLGLLDWQGNAEPPAWARAFEEWAETRVERGDLQSLLRAKLDAPSYALAVPTPEHFHPLYFALGAADGSTANTVFQGWQLGSLSLRCWAWS